MIVLRKRGVTFHADATVRGERIRASLGTRTAECAKRLVNNLELAVFEGSELRRWADLQVALPHSTFVRFAEFAGVKEKHSPTCREFRQSFESDMNRRVQFGELQTNTVLSYQRVLSTLERFLDERKIKKLQEIDESVMDDFKVWRLGRIRHRTNSTGRSTLGLEIDMLHHAFSFAVDKDLIKKNPVRFMSRIWEPENSAQPFTEDELTAMRNHLREDWFLFLLLRWTGFRSSDVVTLLWREIDFLQKEIEHVCKKNRKKVYVPIGTEFLTALKEEHQRRNPAPNEPVLSLAELAALKKDARPSLFPFRVNIMDKPLSNRELIRLGKQVYRYVVALGERAGVRHAHPHRFRTTFAVDLLVAGEKESSVARMLGDTLETIMKHYIPYVPVLREQTRVLMDAGKGIEKRVSLMSH
jgi:site-specific recombinase XerD